MAINNISAKAANEMLSEGNAVIIDVRSMAEHNACNIEKSIICPLPDISYSKLQHLVPELDNNKIIIHCKSGFRSNQACKKLLTDNPNIELYNMEGGITAWQKDGFNTVGSGKIVLPTMQQTQLVIGVMVSIFCLLALFANYNFIYGALFFGLGLIFAGLTGFCGLAKLLDKMPWNQKEP